ncbi:MAG: transketolase C-terminal domain-containing protein, partial [Erysipelotrichaceae bacterium]
GDLQEGVCQESLSLAGTLQLKKLIVLYDSNDVQLDGEVSMVNTENVRLKYEAMGFDYFLVEDGTDCDEISAAIDAAKSSLKPSLIEIKTQIGYGSPLAGDCSSHGAPLGQANTLELKEYLEWTYDEFEIPEECYEFYNKNVTVRGEKANTLFNKMLSEYQDEYPDDYVELEQYLNDDYVLDLSALRKYNLDFSEPTKNISGHAIADISMQLPFVVGGCADVVNTTKARGSNGNYSVDNRVGRNIMYGVREFAMGAIANAITLYHGFRGFAGCFLVFSDYMKPALRLAALMKTPTVFTFSHDTIAVGEDGPTHQPIEQLTMLRSIPNFNVIRSCDANETNYGYQIAFNSKTTPTAIITTRQALPTLPNTSYNLVAKGAYNVFTPSNEEDVVVVACGSEVHLALDVAKELEQAGVYVRVVSMPSMFLFDQQSDKYKETILPKDKKIIALEMGHPMCWYKYTPYVYGIDTFGESGPAKAVLNKFGFTTEKFKGYVLKIIG